MDTDKTIQLIAFLQNQTGWVPAHEIAKQLGISIRSVNNYISRINSQLEQTVFSSNRGYKLNANQAESFLADLNRQSIPEKYSERKKVILEKILLLKEDTTLDELSEVLCISPLTLQNEINRLRTELTPHKLILRIKNNHVSILGSERDKRKLVTQLINQELENSTFSLDSIQRLFLDVDLEDVRNIVLITLKKHKYFLDDYSLLNYVLHIAVLIELTKNRKDLQNDESNTQIDFRELASAHVLRIIEEIFSDLKKIYDLDFTNAEFMESSLSLMTNAISSEITKLRVDQLDTMVGKEIVGLLDEIVNSVKNTFSIDLKEDNFLIRFAFHLKNLLARMKNNIHIRNSQFKKIKDQFPFIYVIAVYVSNLIRNRFQYVLSEDEIAYIALHIGVLIEEKNAYMNKLTCVVLAPDFYTESRSLYKKLRNRFSDSLLITKFITSVDELEKIENYDLLFSTIEIMPGIARAYVLIDPFLSENTINRIYQKIEETKIVKTKQRVINQFKYFFREDLFFYNQPFHSHSDAIEMMCDVMLQKQYVDTNYKREIYEHENMAPSSYGNIAIPHPLSTSALSSVIAISINPAPIKWGNNKVNIVFMLSLREEHRDHFKDIFDSIAHFMTNKEVFSKIMASRTYKDFIDTMVSYTTG